MKILIATATAGAGHLQAAAALEEAWKGYRPQDVLERVDILNFTPKLYRKAYAEGYVKVAEKTPELYAHAFRKTDSASWVKKMTRWRRLNARMVAGGFIRYVDAFKPDIVLCPHFMPPETLGSVRGSSRHAQPFLVTIVTDFEAHALWMEPSVDLYCVAMPETKARLVARGIEAKRVVVTGIPVSKRFLAPLTRSAMQKKLGLAKDLPTLLVLGGGMGMGPLVETLAELDKTRAPMQMIVVAGKNEALKKKLEAQRYTHPTKVFGFVTTMQELMAASDLIVTKPGGLTTSESLALGKPLLVVNPLPGQEEANSDFLLEHGAALKVNRLEDLPYRVTTLLRSGKLAALGRAAKSLGRRDAAMAVCRAAIKNLPQ